MSNGVCVNRVVFDLNESEFSKRFRIYEVKNFYGQAVRDLIRQIGKIRTSIVAIRYAYKEKSYLMCKSENADELCEQIHKSIIDFEEEPLPLSSVPKTVLLDLLSISMNHRDRSDDELVCSNMEGSLYVLDATPSENEQHIQAMNIKFTDPKDIPDLIEGTSIKFGARSFCDTELKDKMRFRNKPFESYTKYVVGPNGTMTIYYDGLPGYKNKKKYILHGCKAVGKAGIPFFSINKMENLEKSKMGLLYRSMERLRKTYPDIIKRLEFVRTDLFDKDGKTFKKPAHADKNLNSFVKERCADNKFHLINKVQNEESKAYCKFLKDEMKEIMDIDIESADHVSEDVCNFVLLKDKKVEGHEVSSDIAIQHITMESLKKYFLKNIKEDDEEESKTGIGLRSMINVSVLEVLIKKDIIESRDKSVHRFNDWFLENVLQTELDRRWYFMDRIRIKNPDTSQNMKAKFGDMVVLTMETDGSMSYEILDEDDLLMKDDEFYYTAWQQFHDKNTSIKGVISDGKNTFSIVGTDIVMIPEIEKAREHIKTVSSTTGMRTKEGIQDFFKACIDVNRFNTPAGDSYYYVGIVGEGMNTTVARAASIRHIQRLMGDEPFCDDLFQMMLVPFVKFKGLTVLPYPFKFIHEIEKMNGLESALDEDDDEDDEFGVDGYKQFNLFDPKFQ